MCDGDVDDIPIEDDDAGLALDDDTAFNTEPTHARVQCAAYTRSP